MVTILVLGYEWFISRTALAVTAMGAVGFVVLNFVIDLVVRYISVVMLQ